MNALLYPIQVNKTFSYIAIIRCEVEKYFNVDIKSGEKKVRRVRYRIFVPIKKATGGYYLKPDGLKNIRGKARKYFCYFAKVYLDLSTEEIGSYLNLNPGTVQGHVHGLSYFPSMQEEKILLSLSDQINDKFIKCYKLSLSGG
jgi:hypothetical protein